MVFHFVFIFEEIRFMPIHVATHGVEGAGVSRNRGPDGNAASPAADVEVGFHADRPSVWKLELAAISAVDAHAACRTATNPPPKAWLLHSSVGPPLGLSAPSRRPRARPRLRRSMSPEKPGRCRGERARYQRLAASPPDSWEKGEGIEVGAGRDGEGEFSLPRNCQAG